MIRDVRYRVDEPAHGILRVDGVRVVYTRFQPPRVARVEREAKGSTARCPPARYRLVAAAAERRETSARRRPSSSRSATSSSLGHDPATAQTRFGVRVEPTRAVPVAVRGQDRIGTPGLLVLRAPDAGRYTLFVEANGHGARAASSSSASDGRLALPPARR